MNNRSIRFVHFFSLRQAFLDHYDEWKLETVRRTEAVVHSKHDELDKEMDLQVHLHEPRRVRIETDIHHVRTGKNRFFLFYNFVPNF